MSNELDRLTEAFRKEEPILPREEARKANIAAAMQQFDAENSEVRQGIPTTDRLKGQGNTLLETLRRRLSMTFGRHNLTYILTGSASLAAMAIVVMNTSLIPELTPNQGGGLLQTITTQSEDAASPPVLAEEKEAGRKQIVAKTEIAKRSEPAPAKAPAAPAVGTAQNALKTFNPAPTSAAKPDSPQLVQRMFADESAPKAERRKRSLVSQLRMAQAERKVRKAKRRIAPAEAITPPPQFEAEGRDKFSSEAPNPVKVVIENPVSTFSVDVDTASYAFMRASLNRGVLPQKNAVRIEEMVNYFDYDYQGPDSKTQPFKANASIMPSPWNAQTKLLRIGIKGYTIPVQERPRTNLVFLLDTSGSMNAPNKLPLLRNSFKLLLQSLQPEDTVAIVTYAGRAGTVLEPTRAGNKAKILAALDRLHAGGSTAGAAGIQQAYRLAEQNMEQGGVNRVILATDGDFNVGITNREELKSYIERKRKTDVTLSVLGFGMGNYNDALMQTLAQNGNGNANYIDSLNEARKVLVKEAGSTLFTIAKDVKLQLEFNPARVAEYRLIGYETRILKREDFNNDKVDAGDIGAGHTVTALYEITPPGANNRLVDDLRYAKKQTGEAADPSANEYAFMKIRYKLPQGTNSSLITAPISTANEVTSLERAPSDARFAAAVAAFGQLLRGGQYTGDFTYDDVIKLANGARGQDEYGQRAEFVNLVRAAKTTTVHTKQ